jgi:FtsP/CotA-like multicopper oxidase with cupredoxin domain
MDWIDLKIFDRRSFLQGAGKVAALPVIAAQLPALARAAHAHKADFELRIAPIKLEIAPGINISTLAYNGHVPGTVLNMREGVPVTIDVTNASAQPDIVHWHGLAIDTINDGAVEEGSPPSPVPVSPERPRSSTSSSNRSHPSWICPP